MKQKNKFTLSRASRRRLDTTSKYLQMTFKRALSYSPIDAAIPWRGGLRSAGEQKEIFNLGHSKCDGVKYKSNHQRKDSDGLGKALDVVPYIKGVGISYNTPGRFGILGTLMLFAFDELKQEGKIPAGVFLHWGGFWKPKSKTRLGWDMAHYELRDKEQKILI